MIQKYIKMLTKKNENYFFKLIIIHFFIILCTKILIFKIKKLIKNGKLKFPIIKTLPRASEKRFGANFSAKRPNLFLGWEN